MRQIKDCASQLSKIVVCSRSNDYQSCRIDLEADYIVELNPLNKADIEYCLKGEKLEHLMPHLEENRIIFKVICYPLFLKLFITNLKTNADFANILLGFYSSDRIEIQRRLLIFYFENFIEINSRIRASPEGLFKKILYAINCYDKYSSQDIYRWTLYLAKLLECEKKRNAVSSRSRNVQYFLIERLQPTLLTSKSRTLYRKLNATVIVLAAFPAIFLFSHLLQEIFFTMKLQLEFHAHRSNAANPFYMLSCLAIAILIFVWAFRQFEINPVESVNLSLRKYGKSEARQEQLGYFGVLLNFLPSRAYHALASNLEDLKSRMTMLGFEKIVITQSAISKSIFGATSAWIGLLIERIGRKMHVKEPKLETILEANQGIRNSVKVYSFLYGGLFFLPLSFLGLLANIAFPYEDSSALGIMMRIFCFGITGFLFGILYPLFPVIQHLNLRLMLFWRNEIPWNYCYFLDFSTNSENYILARSGGGYRFIHPYLQHYLSELDIEESHRHIV